MLVEFKFANYRSFRDETSLSMKATGIAENKQILLKHKAYNILPAVAIYGKNGGGKSNIIRAFWLATQFIKNAQRTQHENAIIPVRPFLLNDYSKDEPVSFEFTYIVDNIKYIYGFSASKSEILSEYLYYTPKGQRAKIFSREKQEFSFPENGEKRKKEMISSAVGRNQLFFSIACTMNYSPCIAAMKWFREKVFFSRDFTDIPKQLFDNADNKDVLRAIESYAKQADLGILGMSFEFSDQNLTTPEFMSESIPEEVKLAIASFMKNISESPNVAEINIRRGELKTKSLHSGVAQNGITGEYSLELADESDGTRRLMAIAPNIESALVDGGVLIVDELESALHPLLVEFILAKFQSPTTNKAGAQLVFATHNTELLDMSILRKDQVYFVDKDNQTGVSELYKLTNLSPHTHENIRKGYLLGKYGAVPNVEVEEL